SLRRTVEIAAAFRAGVGLEKLFNIARRFGDAYRRAATEILEEASLWRGVRWPAIGEGPHTYGDIHIHPLQSPTDLAEEGVQMENCVARYVEHCMKGTSQIWSVRLCDGTRLSTLETRIRTQTNGRRVLEVQQHQGVRNGTPTPLAWQAVREHANHFSQSPEQMLAYLTWKQTVAMGPLKAHQRHALMQPIITALEQTLSGQWSWQRLVGMGIQPTCAVSS
ncbi:MAG: PcfJ domain-containing protein, partial [bacterium]